MAAKISNPPIICTDDGAVLSQTEPPLSIETLKEQMVDAYAGTPAALWWSIGDHEIYYFETRVGEIVGEGADSRMAANVRHLMATCGGPLTALIELFRQARMQFFPRVRMNSHYDIDPATPGFGRFRRENPDLLIGRPGESIPAGSTEDGLKTGLNYAFPEVRVHMAGVICELFERFDVDGVELDFMRHPGFFRPEEAYANRYLMTDLIRHVRHSMDSMAATRGRAIQLAIRVPPTLADSARIGLEVAQWMAEGLVDLIVVGGGFIPYETPIEEFVAAGAAKDIQVYGCIEATRHADEKNLRALASRFWAGGAAGIYLYNFYTKSPEWNQRVLNQLADPVALQRLDKRYELDQTARFTTPYHCAYPCDSIERAFRYGSPDAQLPVILTQDLTGNGPALRPEIADDLEAARREGALGRCVLSLRLDHLAPGDALEVRLNRELLPWDAGRVCVDGWMRQEVEAQFWEHFPARTVEVKQEGASVEFDLDVPPLRRGKNVLEVCLASGDLKGREPVVLKGVEITIAYGEQR